MDFRRNWNFVQANVPNKNPGFLLRTLEYVFRTAKTTKTLIKPENWKYYGRNMQKRNRKIAFTLPSWIWSCLWTEHSTDSLQYVGFSQLLACICSDWLKACLTDSDRLVDFHPRYLFLVLAARGTENTAAVPAVVLPFHKRELDLFIQVCSLSLFNIIQKISKKS